MLDFSGEAAAELPLASASIVWPNNWLSEVAKASDAAAELPLSTEKLLEATTANKKTKEAIIIVACFNIYIPLNIIN
ncbi:MAG: hypothetical protein MUE87_01170 [Methanothrix sp.]|nr:hypothetical protein [Methanothrix sp.]